MQQKEFLAVTGRITELTPIMRRKRFHGKREFVQVGVMRYLIGRRLCNVQFYVLGMPAIKKCDLVLGGYGTLRFFPNAKLHKEAWHDYNLARGFTHMTEAGYADYLEERRKQGLYAPRRDWKILLQLRPSLEQPVRETETYDDGRALPF